MYTIQFGTEKQREKFIQDKDWRVRATVFQYGSNEQRQKLINDEDSFVRQMAEFYNNKRK